VSAPAALITGGTGGISQATARLLDQRGYQVMVTGQNPVTIAAATEPLGEQVVMLRADAMSCSAPTRS
jgi:NADP-dependent 3-hydroxy acid dehydrogenase YdfG